MKIILNVVFNLWIDEKVTIIQRDDGVAVIVANEAESSPKNLFTPEVQKKSKSRRRKKRKSFKDIIFKNDEINENTQHDVQRHRF
jgi:1,2-phenylacetyl-CoA epoxidase PaaB subunit